MISHLKGRTPSDGRLKPRLMAEVLDETDGTHTHARTCHTHTHTDEKHTGERQSCGSDTPIGDRQAHKRHRRVTDSHSESLLCVKMCNEANRTDRGAWCFPLI